MADQMVTRAVLSRRGRQEFGLPVTSSWRTANYAYPRGAGKDRGQRPSYPITPTHVKAARSFAAKSSTAGSLAGVDRALRLRYGSVQNALAAANRSSGGASRRASSGARRGGTTRRTTSRRG